MKPCPHCGKNQFDSAVTCSFCRQAIARPGAPAAASRPAAAWPVPASRPAARVTDGEEPTLNPFVLFGRCFRPSGRFSRAQFAVVYLGTVVAAWFLAFAVAFFFAALDAGEEATARAVSFALMAAIPFVLVAAFGGGVRRWHDLGKPGAWVLLWLVPCANALTALYLLLAPGESERGGRGMPAWAVALVVVVIAIPGVGIVAAIAIPSLLRARVSANEAAAIGDVRAVVAAEAAYQRANAGLFDGRLECLVRAADGCAPGAGGLLDAALAQPGPRHGYVGRLEGAPSPAPAPGGSTSSASAFAYVARPLTPGVTGVRSFCGDSTGLVCFSPAADIAVVDGACPRDASACQPFQAPAEAVPSS
ncbi:MAG: DUF805 domain-containing protein [Vicinamibacteria bacterium]